jgi:hemin uptake protein HemP
MSTEPSPEAADAAPEPLTRDAHDDPTPRAPRMVSSAALLAGRSQLAILHNETVYFLRHTRFGKLILTK